MTNEVDPFEGCSEIEGLEHLGRAIVDANGIPSGSPANFEATRGKGAYVMSEQDRAKIIAALAVDSALVGSVAQVETPHPWAKDAHD